MSVPTIRDGNPSTSYTFPDTIPEKSPTFVRIEKLEINNTKNVYIPPRHPSAEIITAIASFITTVATVISAFIFTQHSFSASPTTAVSNALRAIIKTAV